MCFTNSIYVLGVIIPDWQLPKFTENTHNLHKIVYTMSKNCLRGEWQKKGGDVRMGGKSAMVVRGDRRPCLHCAVCVVLPLTRRQQRLTVTAGSSSHVYEIGGESFRNSNCFPFPRSQWPVAIVTMHVTASRRPDSVHCTNDKPDNHKRPDFSVHLFVYPKN